jgi:hypothetical protein
MNWVTFSELLGKIFIKIEKSDECVTFHLSNGAIYELVHDQECGEVVTIDDIDGDLDDLIGNRILQAEESYQRGTSDEGTSTWSFYKLATIKGYVTIKWYGESNGYYSESAELCQIKAEDPIREQRRLKIQELNKKSC